MAPDVVSALERRQHMHRITTAVAVLTFQVALA